MLFAVTGLDQDALGERLSLVERYFGLAANVERIGAVARGTVALPALDPGGGDIPRWWWGERPPATQDEQTVLAADDAGLRVLDGTRALFAADESRLRVIEGASGARAVTTATQGEATAWSTHAACTSLLAFGGGELDEQAVLDTLEVLAPLGERTLLAGVRVLRAATVVDVDNTPSGPAPVERSYWPACERWADPGERPESVLGRWLVSRFGDEHSPWLALTAGRDSNALLGVALRAGVRLPTFTWGEDDWGDVAGARHAAGLAELSHLGIPYEPLRDPVAIAWARDLVRQSDGVAPMGAWARPHLPPGATAVLTGSGGEIGRAYHYASSVRERRWPLPRHLARMVAPEHAEVQGRVRAELERVADETGRSGWDLLDVFYAEHRMGRWGRARVGAADASFVGGFLSPPVSAALLSLPLEVRVRAGWHRAMADPRVALAAEPQQRPGVPAPLRRMAAHARRVRSRHEAAWPWAPVIFGERPGLRAWLADDALTAPGLAEVLGRRRIEVLRNGLRSGIAPPVEQALTVAGAGILDRALRALRN